MKHSIALMVSAAVIAASMSGPASRKVRRRR